MSKKPPSKSSYAPLQKKNTDTGDEAAARLWAIFRKENGLPPKPTREEIEGSGAEAAVLELSIFALARPIPIYISTTIFNPQQTPTDVLPQQHWSDTWEST